MTSTLAQSVSVSSGNLFPIGLPTEEEALTDYDKLKEFDGSSLIRHGDWFSRSEFDESYKRPIYIGPNKVGMKASDRHHWYARMACDSINSPSPIRNWYQLKHRATLENSKFFEKSPRTAMALRKYIASQFRPAAALAVYDMFGAKSVYDPCGGWGDRLVAAMAKGIDYHCRDVNPLVLAADSAIQQSYKHTGLVKLEFAPSESSAPDGNYNLVFTSPPYWKVEKYQGGLSSHAQYKKFDDWMRGGYIARGTKVLKKLPIRVIDFNDKGNKKLHDNIASIQKSLIELQHQIDLSAENKREVTPLKRQFINGKAKLEKALKDLYGLGNDDDLIPLISELYNAAN